MENQSLVELTADIVASHVTNNHVSVGDLPNLIQRVHEALAGLSSPAAEEPGKVPVVSVQASIKPDYLVCMECGRKQKTLRRHLATAHGMTPEQYRADYGLPADYPMTAPNYSERRRTMAKAIGLGRKPGARAPVDAAPPPETAAAPPERPESAGAPEAPEAAKVPKAPKASKEPTRRPRKKPAQ